MELEVMQRSTDWLTMILHTPSDLDLKFIALGLFG
jgi:hypothetical protein